MINSYTRNLRIVEELLNACKLNEALQLCDRQVREYPNEYHAYELRSSIHRRMRDYPRAIEDLNRVIELEPKSAAPHFRKARYLMSINHYNEAVPELSKALELDDGYFGDTILFYRAEALLRCSDYFGALRDCKAMKENYSEPYFLGRGTRSRGDIETEAKVRLSGRS